MQMPTFDQMMEPTVQALEKLGGSGSIEEIASEVIQLLNLPEEITSQMHKPEKSSQTEVEYRLAWTRTYLKKVGLLENSDRGVWAFTNKYNPEQKINPRKIVQTVRESDALGKKTKKKKHANCTEENSTLLELEEEVEATWREHLHQSLLKLKPDAFERLGRVDIHFNHSMMAAN